MTLTFGENHTLQHSWDLSDWTKTLTQFYFQLVRNADANEDMAMVFRRLLALARDNSTLHEYLMRVVVHTRDIQKGKGERDLFYFLLQTMTQEGYLDKAVAILRHTCRTDAGSWKDIKYLVYYLMTHQGDTSELIPAALQLLSAQIETDYEAYQKHRDSDMSLAARWAPRREKGKFAPVTRKFVETIHASRKYTGKSMRDVRKMLALLNRDLKTPQIDMCRGTWSRLNFNSMTSYTLLKHKKAFLNLTKQGEPRSDAEDRVECAQHYTEWLHSKDKKIHVSTIHPFELVRDVSSKSLTGDEMKYYNDAWKTQTEAQIRSLTEQKGGITIPMIDVSGSMSCDNSLPMHNAIALGLRLSELNVGPFRNQALTFQSNPSWAHYSDSQSFCEKVEMTLRLPWGGSTNLEAALHMILRKIEQTNLSPLAVQHMSLIVFSDMQMDQSSRTPYLTVYESMKAQYREAGLRSVYRQPFEVPHVVFWNLRKTNGFPTIGNEKGATMISGYNASMIEVLLIQGSHALRQMTPWDLLRDTLDSPRFKYC